MIVCSCNVLTDDDIRSAMSAADASLHSTHQVYGCLGCKVECGRCVGTIRQIMGHAPSPCDIECGPEFHATPSAHPSSQIAPSCANAAALKEVWIAEDLAANELTM